MPGEERRSYVAAALADDLIGSRVRAVRVPRHAPQRFWSWSGGSRLGRSDRAPLRRRDSPTTQPDERFYLSPAVSWCPRGLWPRSAAMLGSRQAIPALSSGNSTVGPAGRPVGRLWRCQVLVVAMLIIVARLWSSAVCLVRTSLPWCLRLLGRLLPVDELHEECTRLRPHVIFDSPC